VRAEGSAEDAAGAIRGRRDRLNAARAEGTREERRVSAAALSSPVVLALGLARWVPAVGPDAESAGGDGPPAPRAQRASRKARSQLAPF